MHPTHTHTHTERERETFTVIINDIALNKVSSTYSTKRIQREMLAYGSQHSDEIMVAVVSLLLGQLPSFDAKQGF